LDHLLKEHHLNASDVQGYEREEYTHLAVAVNVHSGTADSCPELGKALHEIIASDLFTAQDFPEPKAEERMAKGHLPLFGAADTNEASTDKDD